MKLGAVSVHYQLYGNGSPVIFLHGGGPGCSALADFSPALQHLCPGRSLVLIDLPQYGSSTVPYFDEPIFDFHARHVLGVMNALSIDSADFVGQSLGGSVALALALVQPKRVHRIALTGSQPVPHAASNTELGLQVRSTYYGGNGPTLEKMRRLLGELEWSNSENIPEDTVRLRYENSIRPEVLKIAAASSGRGQPQDLTSALGELASPVLMVWGAEDPFAPPAYAIDVAALIPQADVVVMGATAHHPQEERPLQYADFINTFLN